MRKIFFSLAVVTVICGAGAPRGYAQSELTDSLNPVAGGESRRSAGPTTGSGVGVGGSDIQLGVTIGGGLGFNYNRDYNRVCPLTGFDNCIFTRYWFRGYVSGSIDFTSGARIPGLGAGLVISEELDQNAKLTGSNATSSLNESIGWSAFGVGVNGYVPVWNFTVVPTVQRVFFTAPISESRTTGGNSTFSENVVSSSTTEYGISLRYAVVNHLDVEGGISYLVVPASTLQLPHNICLYGAFWGVRFYLGKYHKKY